MPTLAEKGKFQFHPKAKANLSNEMKGWLETDKAVDIIVKVLKMKFGKTGKANRLYFLRGRTGSGKSTYMIQELYNQIVIGSGEMLFCTQPRVVLTKSNPMELTRYNKEWAFGLNIGVQNGNERIMASNKECIYYCTTQIMSNMLVNLLQEQDKSKQARIMKALKIVVIDECHVLDSPMMALLKNVFDVVNKFGDESECPMFVFSSATIDLEHMVDYYFRDNGNTNDVLNDPLMIADVQGTSNYPVVEKFLTGNELKALNSKEEKGANGFELFAKYFVDNCLDDAWKSKSKIKVDNEDVVCRDCLLFVPLFSAIGFIGEYIEGAVKGKPFFRISPGCQMSEVEKWRNANKNKKRILYVGYGRNYAPASDELLAGAIEPDKEARENELKVICSTSVIETGKTIATLYLVLNLGIETMSIYNPLSYIPNNGLQYLRQVPINKNQAIQRKGRVGRECPGVFIHFYTKTAYEKLRTNDIAETVNNSYLSALLLNDLSQFEMGTFKDVFNLNNYYYPTSTDILINSARDLVNAGYLTPFGQFVALKNSIKHCENWVLYAKFLFYCLGYSLWEALLLASLNRKSLPPMMNLYFVEPKNLRYQLSDVNENDDMIESIMRARNMMTSILYGNDETFKCSEYRVYHRLNALESNGKSRNTDANLRKGGDFEKRFDSWFTIDSLGRL